MKSLRIIARLDIKGLNLIKGIHLEGLRVIGNPNEYALRYYAQGADELIFMDCVASLYGRNQIVNIIKEASKNIFIPITVGGGIRSVENVREILRSGADKVAINTAAVKNPKLISQIAHEFGSQCLVISVEAKKNSHQHWEVLIDNGRGRTGLDVINWVNFCVENGAGEVLITSIDREGTRKGFETDLISAVTNTTNVPVIASGGMGKIDDLLPVVNLAGADAIAIADMLHYNRATIYEIRDFAKKSGFDVREL